jgi:tubulin delta
VGSFYTEFLRDRYPRTTLINNCVWPFSTGEVTLQNYNFLLTLNKLYEHSDGIVLLENDILHKICKRMHNMSATSGNSYSGGDSSKKSLTKKEITFDDLNEIIGHQLASVIQPCVNEYSTQNYLNELVCDLCASSDYKLLSLNNVPHLSKQAIAFSSYQWPGLYKNAGQLLKTGGFMDEGLDWTAATTAGGSLNKTLALSVFARGLGSTHAEQTSVMRAHFDAGYVRRHFAGVELFGSLFHLNAPIRLWYQERTFNNYEKSLTLLSNTQLPVFKIDTLVAKAWRMFGARAYIHQYMKYSGFEEEDLLNSFIFAEQLVKNYKKL